MKLENAACACEILLSWFQLVRQTQGFSQSSLTS